MAAAIGTIDLYTPVWHVIAERCGRLEIDRVPPQLDKCVSRIIDIGTSHVGGPVTERVGVRTPDTGRVSVDSRRIDVVVSCSPTPVVGARNSESGKIGHGSWDKHGFIARKHGLTERYDTARVVLYTNVGGGRLAIWFVWEGLLNVAIVVAIQTAVLFEISSMHPGILSGLLTIDFGYEYDVALGSHCIIT